MHTSLNESNLMGASWETQVRAWHGPLKCGNGWEVMALHLAGGQQRLREKKNLETIEMMQGRI